MEQNCARYQNVVHQSRSCFHSLLLLQCFTIVCCCYPVAVGNFTNCTKTLCCMFLGIVISFWYTFVATLLYSPLLFLLFSFNCCAKGNIDQWRGESGSSFIERGGTPVRPLIIVMEIILYFSTLDNYCVGQAEIINKTSSHQM